MPPRVVFLSRLGRVALAALLLASPVPSAAQQPPLIRYTVADGLAHNSVEAIVQDAHGYIWLATYEGVSRFDGYEFASLGVDDGLPHPLVTDLAQDLRGNLWVSMFEAGLAVLRSDANGGVPSRAFEPVRVDDGEGAVSVLALAVDGEGALWCVLPSGVYRGSPDATGAVVFAHELVTRKTRSAAAYTDRSGRVWIGVDTQLYVAAAGRLSPVGQDGGPERFDVVAFADAEDSRLFVATTYELWEWASPVEPGGERTWRQVPLALDRPQQELRSIAFDGEGLLWIATTRGLIWLRDGVQSTPDLDPALAGRLEGVRRDRDGNLWIATRGSGLVRVSSRRLASFTTRDGLPAAEVHGVVEGGDGTVYASTARGVVAIRNGRIAGVPGGQDRRFQGIGPRLARDAGGHWWLGTADGVAYWVPPGPLDFRRARPVFSAPPTGAWPWAPVARDAAGDVWIAGPDTLMRATARAGHPVLEPVDLRAGVRHLPIGRVARDRTGALWLSSYGGLTRWRNGRTDEVRSPADPDMMGRALYVDSRGWLWVGLRYRGVIVTQDPAAERPAFQHVTRRDGLGSDTVWAITEGRDGGMYFGTGRGLDRYDPESGALVQTHVADGLAGAPVTHLFTGADGRIWISTPSGLSVLDPTLPPANGTGSQVYLTRLEIDGRDWPLPFQGVESLGPVTLAPNRNAVSVEFVAPSFQSGHAPRYQFRLADVDESWSLPTTDRRMTLAHLAPGRYRLLVRSVDESGDPGVRQASLELFVPVPVWRQTWFVAFLVLSAAGVGAAFRRARTRRLLAMEQLRRQVALDLHDDVGSGLSQIAILSELGREEAGAQAEPHWEKIGDLARSLRESMSDIVWAVDPRHDTLGELIRRMRRVAMDLLAADGCAVRFEAPDEALLNRRALAPDRRRHVLLVFKEAVHNTMRHAEATAVQVSVALEADTLRLLIADDGRGFDPGCASEGHGLDSLRRRAHSIGATLEIESRPGAGTVVRLAVPLG